MVKSLNHFEAILGCDRKIIFDVIQKIDENYYSYKKSKGSGKYRVIFPSINMLRDIHNRLCDRVFSNVMFPYYVTGSVSKRSGVLNAKFHSGKLYHFQTDISGYFDYINYKVVNKALIDIGFSTKIAEIITKLTTYRGHIPQGAPCSSFLSNLIGLPIDEKILQICKPLNITYSRYVDDLTFSSTSCFKSETQKIIRIITSNTFNISNKKTIYKLGDVEITGVVCSCNGLRPKENLITKLNSPSATLNQKAGCKAYINYINRINKMNLSNYISKNQTLSFPEKIVIKPYKKINTQS